MRWFSVWCSTVLGVGRHVLYSCYCISNLHNPQSEVRKCWSGLDLGFEWTLLYFLKLRQNSEPTNSKVWTKLALSVKHPYCDVFYVVVLKNIFKSHGHVLNLGKIRIKLNNRAEIPSGSWNWCPVIFDTWSRNCNFIIITKHWRSWSSHDWLVIEWPFPCFLHFPCFARCEVSEKVLPWKYFWMIQQCLLNHRLPPSLYPPTIPSCADLSCWHCPNLSVSSPSLLSL